MSTEALLAVHQKLDDLQKEISFQIIEPQGGDERIAACNEALHEIFIPEGRLYKICAGAFLRRPDLNTVHANRLIVRAFQRQALRRSHSLDYPNRYTSPNAWLNFQVDVLDDPSSRIRFRRDMYENSVQTNLDERGKTLKLLPLLMPERFGHPLRILELGSGPNQILKKLALNAYGAGYHYDNVTVKRPAPGQELGSIRTVDDYIASEKLNTLLATGQIAVKKFLGIDKDSIKRPNAVEWVRSQFYPSEYQNPAFIEKFDLVAASSPANVYFRQADILTLPHSPAVMKQIMRHGPYDFVLYGTFLYQLTESGREIAEWVGDQVVDPDNGIKVYQDFIDVAKDNQNQLVMIDHWSSYTYRSIIEDMRYPGKKQVLFAWSNGRCTEVQIGPAQLQLDDALIKAEDLLGG